MAAWLTWYISPCRLAAGVAVAAVSRCPLFQVVVVLAIALVSANTWCCQASFFTLLSLLFLFLFLLLLLLRMFCYGSLSSLSCPSDGFGFEPALSCLLSPPM